MLEPIQVLYNSTIYYTLTPCGDMTGTNTVIQINDEFFYEETIDATIQ